MPYPDTNPQNNDTEPVLLAKILQVLNELLVVMTDLNNKTP